MTQRRTSRSRPRTTLGKINKTIDVWLHPLAEENPAIWIVDGMLHSAIEYLFRGQSVRKSVNKFIEYNLIPLLQSIEENADNPLIVPYAVTKIMEFIGIDVRQIMKGVVNSWIRDG